MGGGRPLGINLSETSTLRSSAFVSRRTEPLNRSQQMARIRSKDTTPERQLRSALWSAGLRFRIHFKTPAGRPDIVFPRAKLSVIVDGSFWHGCPTHYSLPRTRQPFWSDKLEQNISRDLRQGIELQNHGWRVLRIWEHEVKDDIDSVVRLVQAALVRAGEAEPADRAPAGAIEHRREGDPAGPGGLRQLAEGPGHGVRPPPRVHDRGR
jgi:DNA mismatch endonuclease, patch repair protein